MLTDTFTLKIGGAAGQGIRSTGLMFAKLCARSGYHIHTYTEYPSLIRGGHNVMQVGFSKEAILSPLQSTNLLIALNQETIDSHFVELEAGSALVYDDGENLDLSKVGDAIYKFPVPLAKLALMACGKELLGNTVALGAALSLLSGSLTILNYLIEEEFSVKGQELVADNKKAAELGYNFVKEKHADKITDVLKVTGDQTQKMLVNGNEAIALGAIAAGMQFTAIYPMTPISNILHTLATLQEEYGFIYKQPEDEISAINMAIGASYAGARSMTATSGGGFCLMTEGLGLSGMTETPLVIIEGMRPGPATGLPSWTEQGDLKFMLSAHQGDFPRIVLAPGDNEEAFYLTREAFNLADHYQLPVIVLVDKNICENDQSFEEFDAEFDRVDRGKLAVGRLTDYQRYGASEDGVSIRALPGSGNFFITNADEHNEYGFSTEESGDRVKQMEKRMQKLKSCTSFSMPEPKLYGPLKADITIVSWGSTKGAILEAIREFPNVNFLHLTWLSPFPADSVKTVLTTSRQVLGVESNFSGQLAELIREKTGIEITERLLKYDGRPIYKDEIVTKIKNIL